MAPFDPRIFRGMGTPPPSASPESKVVHDVSEILRENPHRAHAEFVSGILCDVGPGRREVFAAFAPPFNAQVIKSGDRTRVFHIIKDSGFTSDHHFVRRQPNEGDGGDDVVKRVYAMCEGCVAQGWHLPDTDVSCRAYGVELPGIPLPPSADSRQSTDHGESETGAQTSKPAPTQAEVGTREDKAST